jgi:predicted nicotinamide N-methyase
MFKRNVSDIKFEIASNEEDGDNMIATAVLQQTDIIPGVYEGGLKTWECSVDLVKYLSDLQNSEFENKSILELGCGSALPGVYCLTRGANVDFQDYNQEILSLVTIPNVLINTTNAPAKENIDKNGTFETEIQFSSINSNKTRFWYGDWDSLNDLYQSQNRRYDIILTSETIYSIEYHQRLYKIIKNSLNEHGIVYIAAKANYFGCSGSLYQFLDLVQKDNKFSIEVVFTNSDSIRREIVKLQLL